MLLRFDFDSLEFGAGESNFLNYNSAHLTIVLCATMMHKMSLFYRGSYRLCKIINRLLCRMSKLIHDPNYV